MGVLSRGDVSNIWSDEVCREVANDVMEDVGADGGFITFNTWLHYMRECALRHQAKSPRRVSRTESDIMHAIGQMKIITSDDMERIPSKGSEERREQCALDSEQQLETPSESDDAHTPKLPSTSNSKK